MKIIENVIIHLSTTLLSLWFIIKKYHTIDRTKNQLDFSATLFVCLFVCSKKTGKIESETQGKTILGDRKPKLLNF